METSKAKERRSREGFFEKYLKGHTIDIGFGGDLIKPDAIGYDFADGDATYMEGIENESFDTVYTSHLLEHIICPEIALRNWLRILKKNRHLIIYVPHRDLYEKRKTLPSQWNADHKFFILPFTNEPPNTYSLYGLITSAFKDNKYKIIYLKDCDEGFVSNGGAHSGGEYSIEVVIKKLG